MHNKKPILSKVERQVTRWKNYGKVSIYLMEGTTIKDKGE